MTGAFFDDPNYKYGDATRFYDAAPADFDSNRLLWRFEVAWKGGAAWLVAFCNHCLAG